MKRRLLSSYAIIALCLVVLHSGIANALANCLAENHSNSAASQHHGENHSPGNHDDSQAPSVPTLHCALDYSQAGPMVGASVVELTRSSKGVLLAASLQPEALSSVSRRDLWMEALFKRIGTFSLPIGSVRHLFLSVLRI